MAKIALFCAIAAALLLWCVPVRASKAGVEGVPPSNRGQDARDTAPHGTAAVAAEGEGQGNLFSGSFADSLWTVVAFVTLALVLTKVAWKPMLQALDARQNHIAQQLKTAEDSRQKAERMLDDYKRQGQNTIQQAAQEAQRHHQQTVEQTRDEVLAMRRRAQEEIESARAIALEELWRQTGDIVLRVGTEVLGRVVSPQDNQRLIEEAVARIKQEGGL
jgi:F-type H+-transporting ATPase subunit b